MNILVFTKNWLGDVIFETPAIRAIKENFPNSHLVAVTPRQCVPILEANPYVDEIIPFNDRSEEKGLIRKWRFIQKLKAHRIDKAYLFHRAQKHAWIAYLAGARERIGYDTKWRRYLLTRFISEKEELIHDVEYFLNLLQADGLKISGDYPYEFYFLPEDERKVQALLIEHGLKTEKLVAINPGANWIPKRWPPSYFRELAHRLVDHFGVQIVLTGSAQDRAVADEILNGNSSFVSLAGKTTIREAGALFSKCRLVVSNDTGPLHIASGVGANVLGLFGPTASRETAPLGRGRNVIIHYFPEGVKLPWMGKKFPSRWMELISVEDVFRTIETEKLLV
ncbi:MAG: lipopolysaccharide heptosyltransferase II [Candidatus Omnitrophica bacterium]|nr:lipopolysaccharide heptosyltransferase II [Candidatus Omnitrophota bacterium]